MPGLFGALHLGQQSLHVQQQGMETAGHNLANVNNPAYSRQRINISTSITIPTPFGPVGTGSYITGVQQIRSSILDTQIGNEAGVTAFLEAQQQAWQLGQAILGQEINRQASGAEGVGGGNGVAEHLSDLFNSFHNVSTLPTSLSERQAALMKAQNLAGDLNRADAQLAQLNTDLNVTLNDHVATANDLLAGIARLNKEIVTTEISPGSANDLRDLRQEKIEKLSALVDVQTSTNANGTIDIAVAGQTVVSGAAVLDTLETYDPGDGQLLIRTQTGGAPLSLTTGTIQGTIAARDGALVNLRDDLNLLAATLITEVNAIHASGFGLSGTTGANFFQGTDASDIAVNATLLGDPALLQASGDATAAGDNQVALALAKLGQTKHAALNNQTFSQDFAHKVAAFGEAILSVNLQLADQEVVGNLLQRQRDAISGVSIDEEMTDLMKFQRAFEASARLITTIDEMLQTVINLKR